MTEQELTALATKWAAYAPFDQTGATQDCREIAVGYLALLAERDIIREVLTADLKIAQERVLTLELENQQLKAQLDKT